MSKKYFLNKGVMCGGKKNFQVGFFNDNVTAFFRDTQICLKIFSGRL